MEIDSNIRILVVDDSLVMRRIVRNHLRAIGFESVIEAGGGREALRILEGEKIDLVLSDWCMHGMHGIEVLRATREREATRDIPFIMVTAEAQPHLILEAMQARVSDYVIKPFTRDDLRESIEKVFRERGGEG